MRIAPCRVHDQHTGVLADSLRERLWPVLNDDVTPALLAWQRGVERRPVRFLSVLEWRHDHVVLETGLALLARDGGTVHSEVAEIGEQLLGAVLALDEPEELGCVVDELGIPMRRRYNVYDRV